MYMSIALPTFGTRGNRQSRSFPDQMTTREKIAYFCDLQRPPAWRMTALENLFRWLSKEEARDTIDVFTNLFAKEPNSVVKHEFAFVLGRICQKGWCEKERILPSLVDAAFTDPSPLVRHEAAEALRCFNIDDVGDALTRLSEDSNPDVASTAALVRDQLTSEQQPVFM